MGNMDVSATSPMQAPKRAVLRRGAWSLGVALGVATHVLFAGTVCGLFWFLAGWSHRPVGPLWMDVLLALQFAVPHSLLLYPPVRKRLGRWIAPAFYGLFYCCVTCVSLWCVFLNWRQSDIVLWELDGWSRRGIESAFAFAWVSLFYSLHLSGLSWQTGLTPWWQWVRRKPLPRREFKERGWYRWFRHPIYLSFLGLIWFTPRLSLDHALLTGVWTAYIFVGSWLKDRRLEYYVGNDYRDYESRVPGYPGVYVGPLGVRSERTAA